MHLLILEREALGVDVLAAALCLMTLALTTIALLGASLAARGDRRRAWSRRLTVWALGGCLLAAGCVAAGFVAHAEAWTLSPGDHDRYDRLVAKHRGFVLASTGSFFGAGFVVAATTGVRRWTRLGGRP